MALSPIILKPVSALTSSSFLLQWEPIIRATEYVITIARTSTQVTNAESLVETSVLTDFHPGYNGKVVSGLRWEVTNLLPETTYYVSIIGRNATEQSPSLAPVVIGTLPLPNRQTSRGLRVDLAFKEFLLGGFDYQSNALQNLLFGVQDKDESYPETGIESADVYALASLKEPPDAGRGTASDPAFPPASSYVTLTTIRYIKGFLGKVTTALKQLSAEFSSFSQRVSGAITKISPNFPNPYAMFGPAVASQFFLQDRVGSTAVPVLQDNLGYWSVGSHSQSNPAIVLKPKPIDYGDGEALEPADVFIDYLRVGQSFNIAVTSGIGGLQTRLPSVTSDTNFMLIINTASEPGRQFFVKTERNG